MLITTHAIHVDWSLNSKDENQFFYHQATPLVMKKLYCAFYLTYLISNIKTSSLNFDILLQFCPNDKIKV
jgi:hypothetical protein